VITVRWCADCRAEQLFEVPPCADGHGEDCPDLACTGCGAGIVVGMVAGVLDADLSAAHVETAAAA
jgi:hypothetical protein